MKQALRSLLPFCEANDNAVLAKVQLFTGKESAAGNWTIIFGRSPYIVKLPVESVAHWFRIDSGVADVNDSGVVVRLTVAINVIPVSAPPILVPTLVPPKPRN